MANPQTQISAFISGTTKVLLEEYAEAHGLKKAFLVEQALLYHFQALRELPADVIIPPRVVVTPESGEEVLERLSKPSRPTSAMLELFQK